MKSDLSSVKVGDKIWTIQSGWVEVIDVLITGLHHIIVVEGNDSYRVDGIHELGDKHPSAFLENPFEKEITREVEEEILQSFREWYNGFLLNTSYSLSISTIENYLNRKYKPLPTAEEAAEKLGISVEQLKQITK